MPLTVGQKCPISSLIETNTIGQFRSKQKPVFMNKRDRFLAELKDEARAAGLPFRVEVGRGKGGHAMVYVGDRLTTIPSREIDPKTARKIRKQLGLG